MLLTDLYNSDEYVVHLLSLNIFGHCGIPEVSVTFIETVDLSSFLNTHVGVCQHELSDSLANNGKVIDLDTILSSKILLDSHTIAKY